MDAPSTDATDPVALRRAPAPAPAPGSGTRGRRGRASLRWAGAAAAVAGAIHVGVAPEHFAGWAPAGVFLLGAGVLQLGLAVALWGDRLRSLVPVAVLGTAALVLLYVVSRTVGLPVPGHVELATSHHTPLPVPQGVGNGMPVIPGSPGSSSAEPVGPLDLLCLVAELGLLVVLVGLLPADRRRVLTNLLLAVAGCAVVLRAVAQAS